MTDRHRLGPMEVRLLTGFLVVSMTALGVLAVGSVLPHLLARTGHQEAVDTGWLVTATVVAVLTAVLASLMAARRLVAPMQVALGTARDFAGGDHTARVPDLGRPELTELFDALNAAASEVERSEHGRRRLTADIAHELRTPLTILQAGLEELRDGLVPPTTSTLAALHDQATRLGRIVSDLADLSAAEAEGLHLDLGAVDLGEVAESEVAAREGAMATAGLVVRRGLDTGVVVRGDADRLHQVVGNLLANSTAYCRPGDIVDVSVAVEAGQGVLDITDTGPGLDQDEQGHAFDRRWRGRGARGTKGSGLGLAIVSALVAAQGGRVELSSPTGHGGTRVRVTLPLGG